MLSRERHAQSAAGRLLAVGALVFAALVLAFSIAPGTVLADSAAEQYSESEFPQKPPSGGGGNGGSSNGSSNPSGGNGGSSNSGTADPVDSVSEPAVGAATPSQSDSANGDKGKADGGKSGNKADKGKKGDGKDRAADEGEADESEESFFGTGGDSGSGLGLFAVLLLVVPLLAGAGYYLFRRYGSGRSDEQTRNRLKDAVDGGGSSS